MLGRTLKALRDGVLFRGDVSLEGALEAFRQGDLEAAEAQLIQLWQKQPDSSVAALQGQVLRAAGRWREAIDWFEKALTADPDDARPAIAIGQLQRQLGEPDLARASFERVVQECGDAAKDQARTPMRLLALGLAQAELGRPEPAMASLQAALSDAPALMEARSALAAILEQKGRISEAVTQHQALAQLEPFAISHRINQALAHHHLGDSEGSLRQLAQLLEDAPQATVVGEAFQFVASTAGIGWLEPRWEHGIRHWQQLGALAEQSQAMEATPTTPRSPLRVGILTADLGQHPVGHFLEGFLRHHDRRRLQVELIETQPRWESRNRELRTLAHACLQLPQADIDLRRELLRERHYDVIMETSGFTTASGLPLLVDRLAPVQCHYLGFHASTLLPTIDWFIADPVLLPFELEPQFSERIWRLPRPWAAYTPPHDLPPVRALPQDAAPVLGSFNQIAKLGPETLRFWAAALQAVPQAQLLIKHRHAADPWVRQTLCESLEQLDIGAERLQFEGWASDWTAHMDAYNRIDVAVDATPWSSATTAFEALGMGTPLVAIRGATLAGRMSSAVLAGFGEPAWITDTPEQFAATIRDLVADLTTLRAGCEGRRRHALAGALFDGADLAATLTEALEGMAMHRGNTNRPISS